MARCSNRQTKATIWKPATVSGKAEVVLVDQAYIGEEAAAAAKSHGLTLEVVKHPEAKRGFVLLPRRWVLERSFGWIARFPPERSNLHNSLSTKPSGVAAD